MIEFFCIENHPERKHLKYGFAFEGEKCMIKRAL